MGDNFMYHVGLEGDEIRSVWKNRRWYPDLIRLKKEFLVRGEIGRLIDHENRTETPREEAKGD
jgi:hypothetical protein